MKKITILKRQIQEVKEFSVTCKNLDDRTWAQIYLHLDDALKLTENWLESHKK